ncbi:type I 3-dehydroquinate dehydratase [Bacillus sp. CGMCC 1.16607]|uniref:type I 3-dehydroquinate dehydratase n=1 Tax=Bacillus sp. CGMCC 1.16607 TaxID=3351842 RepID=UPI003640826D
MIKTVTVKGITIGEGLPKICVSIIGGSLEELQEEAKTVQKLDLDIVEWRVDFFEEVKKIEKVEEALAAIRAILIDVPLVFTFRSTKEGGEKEVDADYYVALNKAMIETGQVDLIDVELFSNAANDLIELAHTNGVFVIISNHDFEKTPSKEEIVSRLRKAQEMGGDLPKIAVMPQSTADILTLLEATHIMYEQYADRPIITMSMTGKGVISRLAGEIFGSAITFGAAKKASAPGQVEVAELRETINLIHKYL